jgi:hypothetical protein
MNKRKLGSFGLCSMLLAFCLSAKAGDANESPVDWISIYSSSFRFRGPHRGIRQGLRELGYIEGKNIVIEYR